jgi:hypothetical protein
MTLQCLHSPFPVNGLQHRNDHFRSLRNLLRPNSPMLILSLKFAARLGSPGPNSQVTDFPVIAKVTLRLMVSQSVSLGVKPHLGLITRYLLLFDCYGLVFCGASSLTRGRVCHLSMLLALPAQSLSVPSPLRLTTIFHYRETGNIQ